MRLLSLTLLLLAPLTTQAQPFDLQAHRGGIGLVTESTLEAFANALALGVSTLELDTQVSEDGYVVVTHDRQVLPHRCLDTQPATPDDPDFPYVGKYIKDLHWDQIRTLDCGSQRAEPHTDQRTVSGARMVLLSEVFDLVKRYQAYDVMLNIETKVEAGAPHETAPRDQFVAAVIDQIYHHRMHRQVSIQSFDWGALMRVKALAPELPIVALSNAQSFLQCGEPGASPWTGGIDMDDFDCNLPAAAASFGANAISPVHGLPQNGVIADNDYQPFTTTDMVRQAHALNMEVIPWTINDTATMAHLIGIGVDGIITDYPDRLRQVMGSQNMLLPPSHEAPAVTDSIDVVETGILALQQQMTEGSLTAVQLVERYLKRIEAYDQQGPQLNAILRLNDNALSQARALDAERQRRGPRSLLHGIPVVIKDNYNTTDMPTTGASRSLADFVPNQQATQVQLLRDAGAIVLAKTNLHEFAYGITSISSLGGQTRNPYDPRYVPGGSSGGTAAAVAASFATAGMGSDTCGSIRIPAAFNNLVGLRPSKGLSSIHGIMPLSHTQDVAGPLARSITDLAIVLDLTTGFDPQDGDTEVMRDREPMLFSPALGSASLQGIRIGRLDAYLVDAEPAVQALIEQAFTQLQTLGAEVVSMSIPDMAALISNSGLIGHEFETDLNTYLQTFSSTDYPTLEAIVDSGLYHDAVAPLLTRSAAAEQDPQRYHAAMAARDDLKQAINTAMDAQQLDLIAYPPISAMPVLTGENQPGNNCSLSGNSGFPALSLPIGFSDTGLPMGLELLGRYLSDVELLALGYAIEQSWPQRRAPATTP
ncbi:amidase family protein [Pseudohongiella acticola]|jgi:amidase|uniref:amidase family protein n=1 Tax=Pseudohongiella acticola TaxID=1524254 RepID=UPI0030ED105E